MEQSNSQEEGNISTSIRPPGVLYRHSSGLRVVGYVACLMGMAMAGSVYSFNAYSDAAKAQLDLSQTQVEWILSIGLIATCIGFTAGPFVDRFGFQASCCVASLVGGLGVLLLGLAIQKKISSDFGFLCFLFVLAGQGSIFLYMIALMSTAVNFRPSVRGTLFGILDSIYGGGSAAAWSTIYGVAYGANDDPMKENVAGFMFLMAIVFPAVGLLMFATVHHLPFEVSAGDTVAGNRQSADLKTFEDSSSTGVVAGDFVNWQSDQDDSGTAEDDQLLVLADEGESKDSGEEKSIRQLICNLDFQLLFWPFLVMSSVTTLFIGNITFYLKSAHLEDEYRELLTILMPSIGLAARLIWGSVSDRLKDRVPRSCFVLAGAVMLTAGLVPLRTNVGSIWALILTSVLIAMAAGSVWSLVPTIVSEIGGLKKFGLNWGVMMFCSGILGLIFQVMFGAIYDANIGTKSVTGAPSTGGLPTAAFGNDAVVTPTTATCYGPRCYSTTTDIILACCSLSTVMLTVLVIRQRRKQRH